MTGIRAGLPHRKSDFRFTPESELKADIAPCRFRARKRLCTAANSISHLITRAAWYFEVRRRSAFCSIDLRDETLGRLLRSFIAGIRLARRKLDLDRPHVLIGNLIQ